MAKGMTTLRKLIEDIITDVKKHCGSKANVRVTNDSKPSESMDLAQKPFIGIYFDDPRYAPERVWDIIKIPNDTTKKVVLEDWRPFDIPIKIGVWAATYQQHLELFDCLIGSWGTYHCVNGVNFHLEPRGMNNQDSVITGVFGTVFTYIAHVWFKTWKDELDMVQTFEITLGLFDGAIDPDTGEPAKNYTDPDTGDPTDLYISEEIELDPSP